MFCSKDGRTFLLSIAGGLSKIRSVGSVGTEDMLCQDRNAHVAEHANEKLRSSQLTNELRTLSSFLENLSCCLEVWFLLL